MSSPETVSVEIKNWDSYNGRPDVKHPSWFRLSHSITEDQDFDHFSHEEFKAWIHLLCLASKKNSGSILVRYDHVHRVCRISRRGLDGAIKKLQELGILLADVTDTLRARNANVTDTGATDRQTDKTRQDRQTREFDFDAFWKIYPRKIAKTDARDRFERLIRTQGDFDSLIGAVTRFRSHLEQKGTEEKYIPHPATFLGTTAAPRWRDWLDPENGKCEIAAANGAFVGLRDPEVRQ